MDLNLGGAVAIVTGASGGIGSATARALAGEGALVVLVGRDVSRLATVAAEIGDAASTVVADLVDPRSPDRIVEQTLERHGRIDVLVNAAGAAATGPVWELDDDVWRDALELKLLGTVRMLRAVLPVMRSQRQGSVLTIVGETGRQPRTTMLPGAAANAALLTVTKGFADEVAADGVRVNALNPGPTRTPRIERIAAEAAERRGVAAEEALAELVAGAPGGRIAEPEEIARLAVVLVSEIAAHVTGTALTVDGGRTRAAP